MLAPVKGSRTEGKACKSGAGDKVDWIMAGPKKSSMIFSTVLKL
jgi:hypothetical protein